MSPATSSLSSYAPTETPAAAPPQRTYSNALGYLRAFLVVLVVLHHALLAYHPFSPPLTPNLAAQPQWWRAFPVVDTARTSVAGLIVGFDDIFFMSLMFFLSGLFVWSSLQRKGIARFLRDRALRLGIPLLLAISLASPIAYVPAYLQRTATATFAGWWQQWTQMGEWPTGPAWFIGILLLFDSVAALSFKLWPKWADAVGRALACLAARPLRPYATLVSASAAAYVPLAIAFSPMTWTSFGPIAFQTSRILLYALYFAAGIAVGAHGIERGLLASAGTLARQGGRWLMAGIVAFLLTTAGFIASLQPNANPALGPVSAVLFVVCCAASSFAFLAIFTRYFQNRNRILDSLRDNSYGIYLVHYMFNSWTQYTLLDVALPGALKAALAFTVTLALSWWIASWGNCFSKPATRHAS